MRFIQFACIFKLEHWISFALLRLESRGKLRINYYVGVKVATTIAILQHRVKWNRLQYNAWMAVHGSTFDIKREPSKMDNYLNNLLWYLVEWMRNEYFSKFTHEK